MLIYHGRRDEKVTSKKKKTQVENFHIESANPTNPKPPFSPKTATQVEPISVFFGFRRLVGQGTKNPRPVVIQPLGSGLGVLGS